MRQRFPITVKFQVMDIRFYNTLTHQVDPFIPIEPGQVTMYNCGPTVYDYAHIGNFRAFVFADMLRRFLELAGFNVTQVMNITDVGHMTEDQLADGGGQDKMQLAASKLKAAKKQGVAKVDNPDDPYQVADYFTQAFLEDSRALGLKIADEHDTHMPHATAHVTQMIAMIEKLIASGHAYVADGGAVYYGVESFADYGKLSGNTLDKLRGGAGGRVADEHQASKRHPGDFLLWKADSSHIMKWPSPWGEGYPGWHIECSAMATHVHGKQIIDIHTGGEDNIFPHHECEIAQSCGASGQSHFANVWMHTRFLLVEGEKMSKSKGNFFTVRQLIDDGIDPAVIRFELLKSHYRSNMNFTRKGLADSASAVQKLRGVVDALVADGVEAEPVDVTHPVVGAFANALADDLNMSGAVGGLFKWLGEVGTADAKSSQTPGEILGVLRKIDTVLGVLNATDGVGDSDGAFNAEALASQIDQARAAKDFATADRLRQELTDAGYDVMTTKEGTTARKKLV